MKQLILLRHGQSLWNLENKFTGWTDVDLSDHGKLEARRAGQLLKAGGYSFDIAYTSVLKRAIRTLWIVMDEMDLMYIPVHPSWRLNERHYGALQGLNKQDMANKYSPEQVMEWRRSYGIRPPNPDQSVKPRSGYDPRYTHLKEEELPYAESLQDTLHRVLPYWQKTIMPNLKAGKIVLISAHGNSLRALVKHLDNIPDDEVVGLNIPTGLPLVYEFEDDLKTSSHYYLGDKEKTHDTT